MKNRSGTKLCVLVSFLVLCSAPAQNSLRGTLNMGTADVARIKEKAEAGDADAQVTLADCLAVNFRSIEALFWYKRAAAQDNLEGKFHAGQMLLFGAVGIPGNLSVQPNQTEGLVWTFAAATNHHPYACWNMGKALSRGLGTSTNLIAAYAWLKVFSETTPGSVIGKVQMNELALKLDTISIRRAQDLARHFEAGDWQAPVICSIPEGDTRLKLNGITFGGKNPLAIINGKTFSEGEESKIFIKPATLTIKCLKIEKDSATIEIEGEKSSRILKPK